MASRKNVSTGLNVFPRIRFKGFFDAWEQRKLGEIYKFEYGEFNNNPDNAGKFPIYGANGVIGGYTRYNAENSIIIGHMGEYAGSVIYEKGKHFVTYNGTITTLLDNSNVTFYDYSLLSNLNIRKICTSSGLPFLSYDMLNTIKAYSTINKNEQIKISNFFESLDNLITLHQRKYDKLLNVKKALLDKMFPKNQEKTPKIRFKGFFDTWEQRKLGEIVDYVVDNRGKNPDYYCDDGIPVIDNFMIGELYPDLKIANRFIDDNLFENFIRKYNNTDDILITLVGNGIGKMSLFPNKKAVIIQNTLGFRCEHNDKKFCYYELLSNNKEIISLDRGMAQPSIRQDELLDIIFYTTNLKEEKKIATILYQLDNLITLHQRKCEKLKNIKKALLDKMFV